jgi:DNA polymerase (family 10)
VDFYRAEPSTFGILLLIRTGSAEHNIWLAGLAHSKGFQLKYSSGLMKDNISFAGETEESVFSALGLPCIVPTLREVEERKPKWQSPS